ncbi:membrane-spanning 4-domains subfamily A member 6A [Ochotona princeps]|uniref:membrane-spanning 4-domains subfamily A member 6A n=1 Tax=Ochotona princeps TaxID=9978 RepID=UPI002714E39B|nr:membrane-spanning 4-domains subfamily A member 6A [Ochotona princeps]
MISKPMAGETIAVLTTRGINLHQSEKPLNHGQDTLKKYLKAEIKVTGTLQILGGVMVLSLGIILASAPFTQHFSSAFSILLKSGYPFIGALFFILSGVLSILTERRSTKHWVHSSLATSILSVLFALMGSVLLCVNLLALSPASQQCELSVLASPTTYHDNLFHHMPNDHKEDCIIAKTTLTGALSMMLIYTVLELCLAVPVAVLWWKQAHSDFAGGVLFLPGLYKNKPSMSSKVIGDCDYEELLTS